MRELLAAVDRLIPAFPSTTHRQVEMAHKVLSKDMSDLVNSMKLAQKYNNTTVEGEYRKYVSIRFIKSSNMRSNGDHTIITWFGSNSY